MKKIRIKTKEIDSSTIFKLKKNMTMSQATTTTTTTTTMRTKNSFIQLAWQKFRQRRQWERRMIIIIAGIIILAILLIITTMIWLRNSNSKYLKLRKK